MKDSINLKWLENMAFEADIDGEKISLDTSPEHGGTGQGPRPKPLMMVALAGCTAMDVVSLMKKMRVEVEDFSVRVDGELTDEHPKQFTGMEIVYSFKGQNIDEEKIKKAINLSLEKYCGVSATLKKAIKLSHRIEINS
jgi:putative redox protein